MSPPPDWLLRVLKSSPTLLQVQTSYPASFSSYSAPYLIHHLPTTASLSVLLFLATALIESESSSFTGILAAFSPSSLVTLIPSDLLPLPQACFQGPIFLSSSFQSSPTPCSISLLPYPQPLVPVPQSLPSAFLTGPSLPIYYFPSSTMTLVLSVVQSDGFLPNHWQEYL